MHFRFGATYQESISKSAKFTISSVLAGKSIKDIQAELCLKNLPDIKMPELHKALRSIVQNIRSVSNVSPQIQKADCESNNRQEYKAYLKGKDILHLKANRETLQESNKMFSIINAWSQEDNIPGLEFVKGYREAQSTSIASETEQCTLDNITHESIEDISDSAKFTI